MSKEPFLKRESDINFKLDIVRKRKNDMCSKTIMHTTANASQKLKERLKPNVLEIKIEFYAGESEIFFVCILHK